jgi:phosphoribosyl-AMP cyclohydrolase
VTSTGTTDSFEATPVAFSEEELGRIAFNGDGLVPAVVQDASDHAVLMFAWMNAESLRRTLETGRTWFWSRSRQEFWCKGETSGDRQYVRSVHYDCDGDALLVVVDQAGGGAGHTGHRSCFYRAFGADPSDQ